MEQPNDQDSRGDADILLLYPWSRLLSFGVSTSGIGRRLLSNFWTQACAAGMAMTLAFVALLQLHYALAGHIVTAMYFTYTCLYERLIQHKGARNTVEHTYQPRKQLLVGNWRYAAQVTDESSLIMTRLPDDW
uniref:Uncharacterized protein n=1 Tax=Peronospora matthiolae TaxID=2874970 RepID=A0AAV1V7A3_9STRA